MNASFVDVRQRHRGRGDCEEDVVAGKDSSNTGRPVLPWIGDNPHWHAREPIDQRPSPHGFRPLPLVSHPELVSHHSFPVFRTVGEAPKGPIERALSLFADVRAGEGVGVLLLTLNVFLLLGLYTCCGRRGRP